MRKIKILLVLFVICFGFFAFGKMSVNAASGNGNIIDGPIDLEGTNVTQVVIIRDDDNDEGTLICTITDQYIINHTNKSVIIRDDDNDEGTLICSIGYLVETYGTNASVIIRDDDNDEGTLICSIGDYVETYGTNASVVIREDDNDEGTLICSIEEQDYIL